MAEHSWCKDARGTRGVRREVGRVTLRRGHVAKLKQCRLRRRGEQPEGGWSAASGRSVLGKGHSGFLGKEGVEASGTRVGVSADE